MHWGRIWIPLPCRGSGVSPLKTNLNCIAYGILEDAFSVFLLSKLDKLDLRPNVENWIIYFISDRTQICKINGVLSTWLQVNLSIVQGSGIGPTLYPRERPKTLSFTNV